MSLARVRSLWHTGYMHTINEIDIAGFGPSTGDMIEVRPEIERIGNETLDEAIARRVGYQIDNGIVRLSEDADGWKATVAWGTSNGKPRVFRSYSKQSVLNQVFSYLNPTYAVTA